MGVVFATKPPTVPAPAPIWSKTGVTWTGHDGSVWDLTDPSGGVCLLRDGVDGFHHPKFKQWVRQSPSVPGQTFTGAIAEPRELTLPLVVFEDASSQAWIKHDRAFWKSMHPRNEGTLTVSPAGAGAKRSLRLRYVPEDHSYPTDPAMTRWAIYVAGMVADQPFWTGVPVVAAWSSGEVKDFFEKIGPHLINIVTGHTTEGATVRNEGDEDAWPVWTIVGPAVSAHMGVGPDVVEVPFEVPGGKALVVDSDPRVRTAIEYDYTPPNPELKTPALYTNPVDRTVDLTGAVNWARIPAGGESPVNVEIAGLGIIQVELTPLYWRAW